MNVLRYTMRVREPLLISTTRGSTILQETETFVPGGVMLGVSAARHIEAHRLADLAHTDPEFSRLYLRTGLRFLNAYPADPDDERNALLPLPRSIVGAKEDPAAALNLIERFRAKTAGSSLTPRRLSGYCLFDGSTVRTVAPTTELHYHSTRDPLHGRALDGEGPWVYEALAPGQLFRGAIVGVSPDLQHVRTLIESEPTLTIGRSKGAQYGRAEIIFDDAIARFDSELSSDQRDGAALAKDGATLTLLSHLVPGPQAGVFSFPPDLIAALQRLNGEGWDREAIVQASTVTIGGYSGRWRMPRAQSPALAAGSTFYLPHVRQLPTEFESLSYGERQGEGFGRVSVGWPPMDVARVSPYVAREVADKPETKASPVVTRLIAARILQSYKDLAIAEAERLSRETLSYVPSNAALGRLDAVFRENDLDAALNVIDSWGDKPAGIAVARFLIGGSSLVEVGRSFRRRTVSPMLTGVAAGAELPLESPDEEAVRVFMRSLLHNIRVRRTTETHKPLVER